MAASADNCCPPRVEAALAAKRCVVACPYNRPRRSSHCDAWKPLQAVAIAAAARTSTSTTSTTSSQRCLFTALSLVLFLGQLMSDLDVQTLGHAWVSWV